MADLWSSAPCGYTLVPPFQQLLGISSQICLLNAEVSLKTSPKFSNRGFVVNEDKWRGV